MSTQPTPITKRTIVSSEEIKRRRRAELRSDALFVVGAVLVTVGLGMVRIRLGLIAGGCFCLLLPCLELATGFIRGVSAPRPPGRVR